MKDRMTSVERITETLHKREVDHIPFWPKLSASYLKSQPAPYRDMRAKEIHKQIGSDLVFSWGFPLEVSYDGVEVRKKRVGNEETVEYEVDGHILRARELVPEVSGDAHPVEYPIKDRDDIIAMIQVYKSASYSVDPRKAEEYREKCAANADTFLMTSIDPSPLMDLCQYKMGLEEMVYLMYDYPDEVDELIAVMHEDYLTRLHLICQNTPSDYIHCIENTSSSMISPQMFERYCLPELTEYEKVIRSYQKHQVLHMCGKLKAFLPQLAKIPALAMEAFTSPTVGDVTISDGMKTQPNKAIIGGTCATTWLLPEEEAVEKILKDISDAGTTRGFFLSSGGVMPFETDIPKITRIWRRVQEEMYGA